MHKKNSFSRKYAYKMIRILVGLATVVPLHTKMEAREIRTQNNFNLPCETLNILNIYKALAIYHREERIRPNCECCQSYLARDVLDPTVGLVGKVNTWICCRKLFPELERRYEKYFTTIILRFQVANISSICICKRTHYY